MQDGSMDKTNDTQKTWRIRFGKWCGKRSLQEIQDDLLAHDIKLSFSQISDLRNPEYRRPVALPIAKRLEPVIDVKWTVAFP